MGVTRGKRSRKIRAARTQGKSFSLINDIKNSYKEKDALRLLTVSKKVNKKKWADTIAILNHHCLWTVAITR
jgi:hypothetical protein